MKANGKTTREAAEDSSGGRPEPRSRAPGKMTREKEKAF